MYSKAIIQAPIIFFFGAGASRPLGKLLMGEFIGLLENSIGLKGDVLFSRIIAQERDLEFLLGELEEWNSKSYYPPRQLLWGSPTGPVPNQFEEQLGGLTARAGELYQIVRREVFSAYRNIQNKELIPSLCLPLFESAFHVLQPLHHPLVVFTTNYDPVVEELCEGAADRYDLIDGFFHDAASKSYIWRRAEFDRYQRPESKKNVVLCKLHGSTSWTKTPKGIIRSAASIYTTDDKSHQNVLIYPAKKKVATEEPFFTAYDYFQRSMEGCKLCITIGYSFRDEDALTRLRSASSLNTDLKVIVVDPNAREICTKKLAPLGIRTEAIVARFGDQTEQAQYIQAIRDHLSMAVGTLNSQ